MPTVNQRILAAHKKIVEHFDAGNWRELGLIADRPEVVEKHSRLLRSLSFGDEDYSGNALAVLRNLVTSNEDALRIIEEYIATKHPQEGEYISAMPTDRVITFSPNVFQIPEVTVESDLIAVMMPFQHQFNPVYLAIQKASQQAAKRCLRADDIWEHATIVQDIFSLIFRASVVVVDFTGKNPNVMYETGIAHTLGKQVVPITQSLDDVPFDIRHHRVLKYLPNQEGLLDLEVALSARVRHLG